MGGQALAVPCDIRVDDVAAAVDAAVARFVLRAASVRDFAAYAVDPTKDLLTELFL